MNEEIQIRSEDQLKLVENLLKAQAAWNRVGDFLKESELPPLEEEQKAIYERTLFDSDVSLICLFLVRKQLSAETESNNYYTLGSLATLLETEPELIKSVQAKIRTILKRVGDYYGLIEYTKPIAPDKGTDSYKIFASERLMRFFRERMSIELFKYLKT